MANPKKQGPITHVRMTDDLKERLTRYQEATHHGVTSGINALLDDALTRWETQQNRPDTEEIHHRAS